MRNMSVFGCSIVLLLASETANSLDWREIEMEPDEIGAANDISPELVMKTASLIKTGKDLRRATQIFRIFALLFVIAGEMDFWGGGPPAFSTSPLLAARPQA